MDGRTGMRGAPSLVAFAYPALALGAAFLVQAAGYPPCHLCVLQRWPLAFAALVGAIAACAPPGGRTENASVLLASLGIICSGAIGLFHAGVEYHWWTYEGSCTTNIHAGADMLKQIMNAPDVPCDEPQWTMLGVSMAGINAVASTAAGLALPVWQKLIQSNGRTDDRSKGCRA